MLDRSPNDLRAFRMPLTADLRFAGPIFSESGLRETSGALADLLKTLD